MGLATTASANNASAGAYRSGANDGVSDTMYFKNLNTSNNSEYFANDHIWVMDSSAENYWVEAGADIGVPRGESYSSPTFEWVDDRPGGGYHAHQMGSVGDASYNTYFVASIYYAGSGSWDVDVDGYTGTSTSNITSSSYVLAGGETSDPGGAKMCEQNSSLQWVNTSGVTESGLPDLEATEPPYVNWISSDTSERSYDNESSSC